MEYYTKHGHKIRNPVAYASTGAPMFEKNGDVNINKERTIYKVNCADNKIYIGETGNYKQRMAQHFGGKGSKVTQKFKPKKAVVVDKVPGYLARDAEQHYVEENIKKYGYDNVRGGLYTNSKTLQHSQQKRTTNKTVTCFTCGKKGHYSSNCFSNVGYGCGYDDDYFSDDLY